jgi:preprotein translocase subunit SecF
MGVTASLLFLVYGVVSFGLGARWLALGLILIGIAVYVTVRFRRIPGLALSAVLAIVTLFVIPLDLGLGSSAAMQPPTWAPVR